MTASELQTLADGVRDGFRLQADVIDSLKVACMANRDIAQFSVIGTSENERPIVGILLGSGPRHVSLIAGAHADEPVGPETLRTFLVNGLRRRDKLKELFSEYTFVIVPHVNPDGESRNRPWMRDWPDPISFMRDVVRELPGRDIEFGFPDLRAENKSVARFLEKHGPYVLHMSLHGMAFAEGCSMLINRRWAFRSEGIRTGFAKAVAAEKMGLHDHNRFGEKGFFYLAPGFNTSPEGEAMRVYFESTNQSELAAKFKMSSMEFVESLGGDPLCLVTEIPLFTLAPPRAPTPGVPTTYLEFKKTLPAIQKQLARKRSVDDALASFFPQPVLLHRAVRLQLAALGVGLDAVGTADAD